MDTVISWPHSDQLALDSEIRSSQKTLPQREIGVWLIDVGYKASSVHLILYCLFLNFESKVNYSLQVFLCHNQFKDRLYSPGSKEPKDIPTKAKASSLIF